MNVKIHSPAPANEFDPSRRSFLTAAAAAAGVALAPGVILYGVGAAKPAAARILDEAVSSTLICVRDADEQIYSRCGGRVLHGIISCLGGTLVPSTLIFMSR